MNTLRSVSKGVCTILIIVIMVSFLNVLIEFISLLLYGPECHCTCKCNGDLILPYLIIGSISLIIVTIIILLNVITNKRMDNIKYKLWINSKDNS